MPKPTSSLEDFAQLFRSKIDKSGEHWLWTGARNNRGYGQVRLRGRGYLAHRVAWMLEHGSIADGLEVCHGCDMPLCMRHLFLGTHLENMRDAVAKGRMLSGPRKITTEIVRAIRLAPAAINNRVLARRYGISRPTVSVVRRGLTWRHVAA